VPFYGMVVACQDDSRLRALLPRIQRRIVTYGAGEDADFRVTANETAKTHGEKPSFSVRYQGRSLGDFQLFVPGAHNVLNATAAIAVGVGLDIAPKKIRAALENFRGVDRRFQHKGMVNGITVIDDYGHHPTEIRASLAAARQCDFRKIHVIFQPHRYTRTQMLMEDFASAFLDADSVHVLDIYAASESPIPGITGERLAQSVRDRHRKRAIYAASFAEVAEAIAASAQEGDMVLTLGAGNISQLGPQLLQRLEKIGTAPEAKAAAHAPKPSH